MAVVILYQLQYDDLYGDSVVAEIKTINDTKWGPVFPTIRQVSGRAFIDFPEVENHSEPIRASSCRLELQADKTEDFLELWTEQEREFFLEVNVGGILIFRGWIIPDGVFQDLTRSEYNITIDAIDGLGFLDDLAYVDENGFNFTGLRKPIKIISDCIKLTGFITRKIFTRTGIVYTGMLETDDPLDNTYLKVDRFKEDDKETTTSAKKVLESVLKMYGLCICCQGNEMYVYDPETLKQFPDQNPLTAFTNEFFEYDPNGNPVGSRKFTQLRQVSSQTNPSALNFYINEDQRLEMRKSIKGVRVNYKYGFYDSLLTNENLNHNSSSYQGWTINNGTLHDFGPNNKDAIIYHSATDQIVMTADGIALAQDDLIAFQYQAKNITNPFTPNLEDQRWFKWRARIGNNNYVRIEGASGVWQSQSVVNRSLIEPDGSILINLPVAPVPALGSLIIEIYASEAVTVGQGFVDFTRFSVVRREEQGINLPEGENHTVQIPGGTIAEDPFEVINGDNPSATVYGTIYKSDQATPTSTWTRIGQGESKSILRLLAEKVVRMNQKPKKYFSGSFYNGETQPMGYLNVIFFFGFGSVGLGIVDPMVVLGIRYDTKDRIYTFIGQRLYQDELVDEIYEFAPDYGNVIKPTIVG